MVAPSGVRWDYRAHTAAKHGLLSRYLDAWFSILGQKNRDLVFIDGFAGPGRYVGGEDGSPILAIKRYAAARERGAPPFRAQVHFWFVEEDPRRVDDLKAQIDSLRPLLGNARVVVRQGRFSNEYPRLESEMRASLSKPATFAFVDPFGADSPAANVAASIGGLPVGEVLLYVPTGHIHRFISTPEFRGKLDQLNSDVDWEAIAATALEERPAAIRSAFAEVLPCRWVRWFEITPVAGGNTYTLIFGTNHEQGLRKMKEAMWTVDPAGGTQYRDTTSAGQPTLFEPAPDFGALERLLRARFRLEPFTVGQALLFTLFSTPFRDDAHLKRGVLAEAERSGRLVAVNPPPNRRAQTYADERLMLRFAA
ncbi:MAG: three-Cys-motif partner protein TcmP [Patulibacter sp.]|nr:three-Cys-motif partner protein TcmP [Patulibacter sp.]